MARARQFNRLAEENRTRSRSIERRSDAGDQPEGGGEAGLRGRAVASVRNEYSYEANAVSSPALLLVTMLRHWRRHIRTHRRRKTAASSSSSSSNLLSNKS